MSKRMMAALALTALLALQGTALAERLEYDTPRDESSTAQTGSCDAPLILGKAITNDELSANELIMAEARKSHLHAQKAAALEGIYQRDGLG